MKAPLEKELVVGDVDGSVRRTRVRVAPKAAAQEGAVSGRF